MLRRWLLLHRRRRLPYPCQEEEGQFGLILQYHCSTRHLRLRAQRQLHLGVDSAAYRAGDSDWLQVLRPGRRDRRCNTNRQHRFFKGLESGWALLSRQ